MSSHLNVDKFLRGMGLRRIETNHVYDISEKRAGGPQSQRQAFATSAVRDSCSACNCPHCRKVHGINPSAVMQAEMERPIERQESLTNAPRNENRRSGFVLQDEEDIYSATPRNSVQSRLPPRVTNQKPAAPEGLRKRFLYSLHDGVPIITGLPGSEHPRVKKDNGHIADFPNPSRTRQKFRNSTFYSGQRFSYSRPDVSAAACPTYSIPSRPFQEPEEEPEPILTRQQKLKTSASSPSFFPLTRNNQKRPYPAVEHAPKHSKSTSTKGFSLRKSASTFFHHTHHDDAEEKPKKISKSASNPAMSSKSNSKQKGKAKKTLGATIAPGLFNTNLSLTPMSRLIKQSLIDIKKLREIQEQRIAAAELLDGGAGLISITIIDFDKEEERLLAFQTMYQHFLRFGSKYGDEVDEVHLIATWKTENSLDRNTIRVADLEDRLKKEIFPGSKPGVHFSSSVGGGSNSAGVSANNSAISLVPSTIVPSITGPSTSAGPSTTAKVHFDATAVGGSSSGDSAHLSTSTSEIRFGQIASIFTPNAAHHAIPPYRTHLEPPTITTTSSATPMPSSANNSSVPRFASGSVASRYSQLPNTSRPGDASGTAFRPRPDLRVEPAVPSARLSKSFSVGDCEW